MNYSSTPQNCKADFFNEAGRFLISLPIYWTGPSTPELRVKTATVYLRESITIALTDSPDYFIEGLRGATVFCAAPYGQTDPVMCKLTSSMCDNIKVFSESESIWPPKLRNVEVAVNG